MFFFKRCSSASSDVSNGVCGRWIDDDGDVWSVCVGGNVGFRTMNVCDGGKNDGEKLSGGGDE